MRIGLIGGTFNPIHNGHLILSEFIMDSLKLKKIIFIPTGVPPHKSSIDVLDSKKRVDMLKLALKDNKKFYYSDYEIKKDEISYTIDTLKYFKNKYQSNELFFLIGGDSLMSIETWKDFKEIFKVVNIVVADRLEAKDKELDNKINSLENKYNCNIIHVPCPIIEISSTSIRKRVKLNKSIKYLVPSEVEEYIKQKSLYKGGG